MKRQSTSDQSAPGQSVGQSIGRPESDPPMQGGGEMMGDAPRGAAIRFLVESALRKVASDYGDRSPKDRDAWIDRLCAALTSDSETSHQSVIGALIANGVSSEQVYQDYVPEAARRLGEMWISDRASFVDVTLGAARLQALFRAAGDGSGATMLGRSIPLGQEILMVIPAFEQHSLGAFVAADTFRRHGVWVRMAIGMEAAELAQLLREGRFAAVGLSLSTRKSVESAGELIEYLRNKLGSLPPVLVGGRCVAENDDVLALCGADLAVQSVREAIERCGLATVTERLTMRENT